MTAESKGKVNVVGGGIAGLIAAAELGRAGVAVKLFESAADLGGRARTKVADGFFLNQGPHALYNGGALKRELDRLSIAYAGGRAMARSRKAIWKGKMHLLPVDGKSLMLSGLFGWRDKAVFARVFQRLIKGERAEGSFADWLAAQKFSPVMRAAVEALGRLSAYANGSEHVSADAMLKQIGMALGGTLYLDHGWSTFMVGLANAAREAGVVLHTGARVERVETAAHESRVILADGSVVVGEVTILAVGPHEAATLASDVGSLQAEAIEAKAVRANTLDLALKRLPEGADEFALGIDGPFYFSLHSGSAKLAPEGGAVVHIAKYLAVGETLSHDAIAELEGIADLVMPGWRPLEVKRQELRGMVVANGMPRWDRARPGVQLADAPGLFIAGDWVGDEGMIADCAAASGVQAAKAAQTWLSARAVKSAA
ncbi:MAG: FAD-dependent oxidoreductase [Hyphomonadaceae bacterium]